MCGSCLVFAAKGANVVADLLSLGVWNVFDTHCSLASRMFVEEKVCLNGKVSKISIPILACVCVWLRVYFLLFLLAKI